jgi:hypothetical protein
MLLGNQRIMFNNNLQKFEELVDKNAPNRDIIMQRVGEMLKEQFIYKFHIDEDLCDEMIQYHKDNTEYKSLGVTNKDYRIDKTIKDSEDVQFFSSSNHPTIKKYFNALNVGYKEYGERYNIGHLKLRTAMQNNIQHYPPGGGFKIWHWERDNGNSDRQLVYMTYLNDVENGGTEWLFQDVKLEAKKGLSVIWPADFTFTHRGVISQTQEKWIATGWFIYY